LRIFLSYHTPDRAVALGLKGAIEVALPGADVFVDQTNLRYGHLWQPSLFDAIARAEAFLILVSHRIGDWQKFEYYEALDRKVKDDAFVLSPVIIADHAKGPAANLPGLSQLHWIESTEPTAPDPLAKIVAALQSRETPKPPEPWRAINPYRGLVALEEQDADFFFGRDRETGEIIGKIIAAPGRFIALVGNSGVGKSSLVQAGVIGSLKRQRWPGGQRAWPEALKESRAFAHLAMKPGEDPIDALMSEFTALWFPDPTDPRRVDRRRQWAERLRQGQARLADVIKATDEHLRNELSLTPPPRVFMYIDQGEELYARAPPAERRRFSEIVADGLASSPQRLIVMTSQRADYYGQLQANAALFKLTEKIDVPPLGADNLALVLREPARVLGVGFESDDLVSHVVKSAEDQPGALPLLADLFTDLWEQMRKRGDGTLRVSDRREIIQVGAALSRRADRFLTDHPDKVEAGKRLFTLRLAHVPRQGEPVRARWEREAKTDPAADAEWAVAEQLAGPDWRLVVTGEKDGKATAEVAHEILLKTWPTLRRWLEDEREFLVWRGELDARRKDYDKAGAAGPHQQRQALLMGLQLDAAKKWLAARRGDIEPADRTFIEASVRAERAAARNRQRLQAAVGVLMLGTIAALLGVIFRDEFGALVFEYTTVRRYIAANFTGHVLTPEAERALKPGDTFRECAEDSKACPDMVVVPDGAFRMGSPDSEAGHRPFEAPVRTVTIGKPFAVGKFEVTWDDWEACVAMRGCDGRPTDDQSLGRGRKPVVNVTWDQAKAYVAWLSRMTGKTYRLLTEAEWEYAARGVTRADAVHGPYPWGDDPADLCRHANLADRSFRHGGYQGDIADCDDGNVDSASVGSYPANAFGLHDMHGNVYEWVEDGWHDSYAGNPPSDGSEWKEDANPNHRVVRGGSWTFNPVDLRSANRGGIGTSFRLNYLGFRVARTLNARAGAITVTPGAP
jgi:formylglycine-generating enzyme required for sulfatase activity